MRLALTTLVLSAFGFGALAGFRSIPAESEMCGQQGPSCQACNTNTCGDYSYIDLEATYQIYRCIDRDMIAPGHCALVTESRYRMYDKFDLYIGDCIKAVCCNGVVDPNRACQYPRYCPPTD
ncbi:MAG: hypothetical protein KIT11_00210 [Fimbriimonadaceae bacterium]|nr:hypothetical protein [Fimbriimonadaceae bacterium]QYK55203.1 MAG: hypothetical protein KF733_09325 [Fimbriimonadaceae bacterium]